MNFRNPEYYRNRELSWLEFNERVLNEARDHKLVRLFERMKFLSITASNLDEFFMIRVGSLRDQVNARYMVPDLAGMTAPEQLSAISERAHRFMHEQYMTYNRSLVPALKKAGLVIIPDHELLNEEQSRFLDTFFRKNIYPVLTPMALDSSRPFPLVRNKTLNIGALVRGKEEHRKKDKRSGREMIEFATVQVPSVLPRIVELPPEKGGARCVILLEEVIRRYIGLLFQHYDVICAYPYRVTRNADLTIDEDEADDLLQEIERQVKQRKWGEVIRLEVSKNMDPRMLAILKEEFSVADESIYFADGPIDLTLLMQMYALGGFDEYKLPPHEPAPVKEFEENPDVFAVIRKNDVLMHHPYVSFSPVIRFIRRAAADPDVLAIKQTLYRVGGDSPIVAALAQAAENGKQVTVLVELKARFDEEHNIEWARKLEQAGCHVIYGLLGLKTHSKITMVLRREADGIRRYVHLGTGNYNESTAKLYTDFGLFTCDEEIGADATEVFNMLSGYSEPEKWNRLIVAPVWMKKEFLSLIRRETENAKAGGKAFIRAKMNSLCDQDLIAALYEASHEGVEIDLLVRGICCLKTGIPGVSETIRVRSIVGDFLEHSRIFWFCNGGEDEIYMGSADWMPRNMVRRVEVVFPIRKKKLKEEARHVLEVEFRDNVKANILQSDGSYKKPDRRGKTPVNSQEIFKQEAKERAAKSAAKIAKKKAHAKFVPMTHEHLAAGKDSHV